ncbi:inositol monophosphatase [Candidatus Woesearchaeota archaeon]|nr:inositol monophosphatase [Candidatus Woesearchaeota archaeon]
MNEDMKEFITGMAKDAGKIALDCMGRAKVSTKSIKNIVTEADVAVEKFIITRIKERFPGHNLVLEEHDDEENESEFTWYIDPIDGTTNYSHGDPHFAVSIGVAKNNVLRYACIFIPMMNELYYAEQGEGAFLNGKRISVSNVDELDKAIIQIGVSPLKNAIDDSLNVFRHFMLIAQRSRDMGFCAGQLAYVAAGRSDGFIKKSQKSWDIAAGMLLVTEAGGRVTDFEGKDMETITSGKHNLIASNNLIHDHIMSEYDKLEKKDEEWY